MSLWPAVLPLDVFLMEEGGTFSHIQEQCSSSTQMLRGPLLAAAPGWLHTQVPASTKRPALARFSVTHEELLITREFKGQSFEDSIK